ncbi:unnamed protein product [Euphydryas editha]|uniref:Uncharacterized protein n=1 Tax=Euphydryas editha TaxID=104508 RepID=A0AAU9U8P7_EUPED|nr:unnamed protein product [Euphydryas editha]
MKPFTKNSDLAPEEDTLEESILYQFAHSCKVYSSKLASEPVLAFKWDHLWEMGVRDEKSEAVNSNKSIMSKDDIHDIQRTSNAKQSV